MPKPFKLDVQIKRLMLFVMISMRSKGSRVLNILYRYSSLSIKVKGPLKGLSNKICILSYKSSSQKLVKKYICT